MLKIVLIGCGWHSASAHAAPLAHYVAEHPGAVSLAAVCDLDRDRATRFCAEYGFARAYTDIEAMLDAETPDAVVSVLPIEHIVEVGSLLLRRKISCVLEKPPGRNLEEASALAAVAQETGTPHMVSLNRRFHPYLNGARNWAREAGPIRYLHGRMLRNARREPDFLWGTGVHAVDAMRYLGGKVASFDLTSLDGGSGRWVRIEMAFASGARGHLEILPTVGMQEERFELYGDDYRASATTVGGDGEATRCWRNGGLEIEERADPDLPLFLRDGSYDETAAFLRNLSTGAPLHPTLDEVLPSLQICSHRFSS